MRKNLPEQEIIRISMFLSKILRHQPDLLDLEIDAHGWIEIDKLLGAMRQHGMSISHAELLEVVERNNKRRYALSADFMKIRAVQGHSIPVDLQLEASSPPVVLYHGTGRQNIISILEKGLNGGKRQFVHLSTDEITAMEVGARHGEPVILQIAAEQMAQERYLFYRSENGVWLTQSVPPRYLQHLR